MTTVIVDYESGNLHSAEKSFQRMAREIGAPPVTVSSDPEAVLRAERIVLPGVGAFVIYALMVILLLLFPTGLLGRRT